MQLTENLIYEYIDKASDILETCCDSYQKPVISSVKISRARSYWAVVKYTGYGSFQIRVSDVFNEIPKYQDFNKRLTSCMIHELIHTIPGCMNHGDSFKSVASLVNRSFPEYEIRTSTDVSTVGISVESSRPDRYVVKCKNCNIEWRYKRRPTWWEYIRLCECNSCRKSNLEGICLV